uniref:NAD kinase-like n=1 Tax=Ciona intestinalis TaxID=7719 RepID=UPI000180AE92|nr:NAD kinase-like [Ciona intestinalis]|eukprot:XP_002131025.1 NAD kinase-like [Ciona intestinalis]
MASPSDFLSLNASPARIKKGKLFKNGKVFRRGMSLHGPLPVCTFGPKASTCPDVSPREYEMDPNDQKLKWSKPPESVLVIKRLDTETNKQFVSLVTWLMTTLKMIVFVESKLLDDTNLKGMQDFFPVYKKLKTNYSTNDIDMVICLGGDGTLLYAASLFQSSMPPVIAFHSGSLGFITSHKFENYQDTIQNVRSGNAILMLRSRLRCCIYRESVNGSLNDGMEGKETHNDKPNSYLCLNEVVVNRGQSQYLCNIDLFLEGRRITSVQGDGLIISTPTGSTAYAVAAGASMVHPNVPAIMVTPICPHSLSFRPIIVPAGAELKFTVSDNARGPASVSFDGRPSIDIMKGDFVTVRTSVHPTPCVCRSNPFDDWFDSLSECLHWNSRRIQKDII